MRLNSRNSGNGKDDAVLSFANVRSILSPSSMESRRSNSLSRQLSSSGFDDDPLENALFGGPASFQVALARKHPPIRDCSRDTGQCYMGVCLPRQFIKMFPNDQMTVRRLSFVSTARSTGNNLLYIYHISS